MNYLFLLLFLGWSPLCLANAEVWLQDSECVLVSSNEQEMKISSGSLISSICTIAENSVIACSDTAKDGTMHDGQPSAINTYVMKGEQDGIMLWEAINYDGKIIFNLNHKKYTRTSTYLAPQGIFTKHCIGNIQR